MATWLQVHWGSVVVGAIGLLGFICVAVGLGIAAGEGDSTVVVIAGVVLVALALLGPDIEQAEFSGRNWAATIRRVTARVERTVDQLSASPDVPGDLKKQIDDLQGEIQAMLAIIGSVKARPTPRRRRTTHKPAATEYVTYHTWGGADEFDVTLIGIDGFMYGARCDVVDPNNVVSDAPKDALEALILPRPWDKVTFTYPKDFNDAPPLTPGRYTYRWTVANPADPSAGVQVAVGAFDYPPPHNVPGPRD